MQITTVPQGVDKLPLQHEVDAQPDPPAPQGLDSDETVRQLRVCEDWYAESSESLADAFAQMAVDNDYYDHLQWTDEEKAELLSRGQAPMVYNKCAMTIDWLTGTERRTRIDFAVHPKSREASTSADVKGKLLKYQSDTNLISWNRSRAFKDAAIGGVGWTEASIRGDLSQELVLHAYQPWQEMKWDPFSRKLDLDDCRYLHRRKWIDLDYSLARFPDRKIYLEQAARSHIFGDEEWGQDNLDLPQSFRRYDSRGAEIVQRRWTGVAPITGSTMRLRVPITETWYRKPRRVQKIYGLDLPGVEFNPNDQSMVEAVKGRYASLSDAVTEDIMLMVWVPGAALHVGKSPFRHGSFPFTPIWCKRRARDGMPYGVIRGIRDAQDDVNKRLSKAQWLLSANQLIFETGAIDDDRKNEVRRNMARPNGMVELNSGGLAKIKIERNLELADAQTALLEISAAHIHDGSGVNRELLGRETNAISGRAIRAKQDEGSVTTAELFDNLRLHTQLDGQKLLSLNEQYMTLPMQIRVAGDDASKAAEWAALNEDYVDEDGHWQIRNDITKQDSYFVVDQVDFRETVRQAQAEQFGEMMAKLPPEVQMALLDIWIDMTEIPQREEAVRRVRSITGFGDVGEGDPQAEQRRAQQEANQQAEQEMLIQERAAKIGLDKAKTAELMARARNTTVTGKGQALQIAELLEILLPLAPTADRLYQTPEEATNAQPNPQ